VKEFTISRYLDTEQYR